MRFTFPVCIALSVHCRNILSFRIIKWISDQVKWQIIWKMASYSFLLLVGIECMQIIRIVCLVIDWLSDWAGGRL